MNSNNPDAAGRQEPIIRVGLVTAPVVHFTLAGSYQSSTGESFESVDFQALSESSMVKLAGDKGTSSTALKLTPANIDSCRATIHDVTIGVDFHWQRRESQLFQGNIELLPRAGGVLVVNEVPLEDYLVSVISSEMSASCPAELLRAHAIVSRSWLLAQMRSRAKRTNTQNASSSPELKAAEIIRWYDRENHADFDVCADDHCQRYQGISKAFSVEAFEAVRATRGRVLSFGGEICDTRYSKSCGGMTEEFRAAWEDKDVPYLSSIYDGVNVHPDWRMPLDVEANAKAWIESSPPAFCNTRARDLLARILPGFDQQTRDFYRWRVVYTQEELSEIVAQRLGPDLGNICALEPLLRGKSGRIIKLQISGARGSVIVGKELEIRRSLSRSHLYSSAFVVQVDKKGQSIYPETFTLIGAGWGHGVGLCQIGAAVMADRGYTHQEILQHYFLNAELESIY